MNPLVLAFMMAAQPAATGTGPDNAASTIASTGLGGEWAIIGGEQNGRPLGGEAQDRVVIRGNELVIRESGRRSSIRLRFEPGHLVRVIDVADNGRTGRMRVEDAAEVRRSSYPSVATAEAQVDRGVRASAVAGRQGVYILTNRFLCIAIDDGPANGGTIVAGAEGGRRRVGGIAVGVEPRTAASGAGTEERQGGGDPEASGAGASVAVGGSAGGAGGTGARAGTAGAGGGDGSTAPSSGIGGEGNRATAPRVMRGEARDPAGTGVIGTRAGSGASVAAVRSVIRGTQGEGVLVLILRRMHQDTNSVP